MVLALVGLFGRAGDLELVGLADVEGGHALRLQVEAVDGAMPAPRLAAVGQTLFERLLLGGQVGFDEVDGAVLDLLDLVELLGSLLLLLFFGG